MAALLKAVHEFAESTAQEPAGAGTAEALAQLAKEAADATLPDASGSILPDAAKYFGDLVPVLIASDREQTQEGGHGWESAAHCVAPLLVMGNRDTTRDRRARSRT
jgi:hypothetical protein